ncbi:putative HTH arsR-type domain-containing protein [Candidatus Magnetomoraceae bacterium gMMP-15]
MQSLTSINNYELNLRKLPVMIQKSSSLANLHQLLTSQTRGDFRMEMLKLCSTTISCSEIEALRKKRSLNESERHIHQLIRFKLIKENNNKGNKSFCRTQKGNRALLSFKSLINNVGENQAKKIFKASLGDNSIRLFLEIYGEKIRLHPEDKKLYLMPKELARLIPNNIEGIASFEKLVEAGFFIFEDKKKIFMPFIIATNFFNYLKDLYDIIKVKLFRKKLSKLSIQLN